MGFVGREGSLSSMEFFTLRSAVMENRGHQRKIHLEMAKSPAQRALEMRKAIEEVNSITWVEKGTRDRTIKMLQDGSHSVERIMKTFRALAERHQPQPA
ncbi:MAG: hypothetical protein A3C50_01745 [Candidatus Staskawiczbacteria bacterium RIFCSPHIGHO2_02_FULL_43_16]|uniref:Uncharacterized protein n=1 Tax=Candidatus Staskawiczbacteria bacterium RIFCSPHIGHO2_01_FULL_41_41 TaxID=1802203 RepID=A0A1G2HUK0_9BACT|nr:MAG: hypothetical protein A2822_04165 [Candidatus Staskawiczbacteria bacterium RIFCSPHIGHO2_01_FULL_41_41]OGZ69103.1 MAG: hypothetical protein A3C50_01745 [Candidatus Staskawiczbacteria bacterium RIFCSPHIGHO2_02_FULL_43_16]OGZ74470.1 MAG: hypothetical protein A3A12_01745 [Candidatus Staskawiczbacteria bacterium RIFCSPLOWO2_01_FULL_43_17b]